MVLRDDDMAAGGGSRRRGRFSDSEQQLSLIYKHKARATTYLNVMEQHRDRMNSLKRGGDGNGLRKAKICADRTLDQLRRELQAISALRDDLPIESQKQVGRDFSALQQEIEELLAEISAICQNSNNNQNSISTTITASSQQGYHDRGRGVGRNPFDDDDEDVSQQDDISWSVNGDQQTLMEIRRREELRMTRDRVLREAEEHKRLAEDIQDINTLMKDLAMMEQQDTVDSIEQHVEHARNNTIAAQKNLKKAETYKTASYPLAGAALGACAAGGPVGIAAGSVTVAAVAAIAGGLAGAFTGKFWKRKQTTAGDE